MPKPRKTLGTVDDIETAFYDALGRADIEALMALWADEEDIACIHPGAPRLVGYPAIRASWEAIFEQGGVAIHPVLTGGVQNLMMAIHHVVEELTRPQNNQQDMHVLATNIYLKTPLGWRIAMHHASIAPGKAAPEHAAGMILH